MSENDNLGTCNFIELQSFPCFVTFLEKNLTEIVEHDSFVRNLVFEEIDFEHPLFVTRARISRAI